VGSGCGYERHFFLDLEPLVELIEARYGIQMTFFLDFPRPMPIKFMAGPPGKNNQQCLLIGADPWANKSQQSRLPKYQGRTFYFPFFLSWVASTLHL